jgi:hypothetical protein
MRSGARWIVSVALSISPLAYAENKLFITDVLDRGQMETQATLRFTKSSDAGFAFPSGTTGTATRNTTRLTASLGGGIIDGFQVDASIPHAFTDNESDTVSGVTRETDRSGTGDLDVGFKFRLAGSEKGPSVFSARLDIKPQTADPDKQGTGATSYTLELAGSLRYGESVRPYAAYDGTYRTNDHGNTHSVRIGAEKVFSESIIATLETGVAKNTASNTDTGYNRYTISLFAYFQTARNLYLIPEIDYAWVGARPGVNGFASLDKATVGAASIALYYLF